MAESYTNRLKTMWEKEKLLVTSNFSFSNSVFKRLVSQGRQKVSLCGNGLKSFHSHISVVVCSFFEFGMVSKWYIREWVNQHFLLFTMFSTLSSSGVWKYGFFSLVHGQVRLDFFTCPKLKSTCPKQSREGINQY